MNHDDSNFAVPRDEAVVSAVMVHPGEVTPVVPGTDRDVVLVLARETLARDPVY